MFIPHSAKPSICVSEQHRTPISSPSGDFVRSTLISTGSESLPQLSNVPQTVNLALNVGLVLIVGLVDGMVDGVLERTAVGNEDGWAEDWAVGKAEGWIEGLPVGVKDGSVDGTGLALGLADGAELVSTLGKEEDGDEGFGVGLDVVLLLLDFFSDYFFYDF
jgi:hypothetical protein